MIFITRLVGYVVIIVRIIKFFQLIVIEEEILETSWTITPLFILVQVALPSILLLYVIEEFIYCEINIKSIGHQWYWSYEYTDYYFMYYKGMIEFDSFMLSESLIKSENFRLLDVDNRAVLPYETEVRVVVTRADVIHSWALPRLGLKVDACPGRLNQVSIFRQQRGVLYGQCSEICGANHRFIPIVVEFISIEIFSNWIRLIWEENYSSN